MFASIDLIDLISIALIGGVVATDTTAAFQIMLSRPLVCSTIIGYLLGDIEVGITFGALAELVWIFEVPIGGNILFDSSISSVVGASIACFCNDYFGLNPTWSVTLALLYSIPVGMLGTYTTVAIRRLNSNLVAMAEGYAKKGNARGVSLSHLLGIAFSYVRGFSVSFLGVSVGIVLLSLLSGFGLLRWVGNKDGYAAIIMVSGLGCATLIARVPPLKGRIIYLAAGLIFGTLFRLAF